MPADLPVSLQPPSLLSLQKPSQPSLGVVRQRRKEKAQTGRRSTVGCKGLPAVRNAVLLASHDIDRGAWEGVPGIRKGSGEAGMDAMG